MKFSNKLTPAEAERLYLLMEECAEVIQAASKVLRHGYSAHHPHGGPDNRAELERECGDVRFAMILMTTVEDLSKEEIHAHAEGKGQSVDEYLHFQAVELIENATKNAR